MGQCIQDSTVEVKTHPFLGYIVQSQQSIKKYYKISFPIANEEEYISWSKNINKLRYNQQIKQYIYLPEKEKFIQAEGMCDSLSKIEAYFSPFNKTLKEALIENIKYRRHFHENFIWYLIYVLVKYIKYNDKYDLSTSNLSFDNLLLLHDGSINIIPQTLLPNPDLGSTIYAQIVEQEHTGSLYSSKNMPQSRSELYIIGLVGLSVADLLHPVLFHNKLDRKWKQIGCESRLQSLQNCQRRYSSLLIQTLTQLTSNPKKSQITIASLYKRLEAFQSQITTKKQLGLGLNLGYSSIQSVRTSYCIQNKTFMGNNSNALRLSSFQNDSTNPSNHQAEKVINESICEKQDYYLNIL